MAIRKAVSNHSAMARHKALQLAEALQPLHQLPRLPWLCGVVQPVQFLHNAGYITKYLVT